MSDPGATAEPLSIHVARGNGVTTLTLTGELDLASAPALFDAVAGLRPLTTDLVIDLAAVTFIDSSGLRALLAAREAAADDRGTRVKLTGSTRSVSRLLELSGTAPMFDVEG